MSNQGTLECRYWDPHSKRGLHLATGCKIWDFAKKWDWRINYFPKKNNPTPNHITQPPKMADLLPYVVPPLGFFWQYLSQKSSYKTGAQTQLGTRI
jgi:hypothetical protein